MTFIKLNWLLKCWIDFYKVILTFIKLNWLLKSWIVFWIVRLTFIKLNLRKLSLLLRKLNLLLSSWTYFIQLNLLLKSWINFYKVELTRIKLIDWLIDQRLPSRATWASLSFWLQNQINLQKTLDKPIEINPADQCGGSGSG